MSTILAYWNQIPLYLQHVIIVLLEVVGVMMAVIVSVAFLTLIERKIIGWMQIRIGPNQIRIFGLPILKGLAQPFADVIKLLLKEVLLPASYSRELRAAFWKLSERLTLTRDEPVSATG